MKSGIVFDIIHFSTSNGPGLRTAVFLKGCPLSCAWCHQPECQSFIPQLVLRSRNCVACGVCLENCPNGAITSGRGTINTNLHECLVCGTCVELCNSGARELVGEIMTAPEVIGEVFKDIPFLDQSLGGVTFSGGEPLAQPEFLLELLQMSKELSMHTVVNTSGFSQWTHLSATLPFTDLYLFDIKSLDDQVHQKFTHASNQLILENLEQLVRSGAKVTIRVPVIPGINDRTKDILLYQKLAKKFPQLLGIELIPYHRIRWENKGRRQSDHIVSDPLPVSEQNFLKIVEALENSFQSINIGR